ncbi:MAG: AAA family ATPase [Solirubrobacterales bacterium]|nr:AAA family ATPase [Solirubrobacterales bacterium]
MADPSEERLPVGSSPAGRGCQTSRGLRRDALLERERELSELDRLLSAAVEGQGGCVLVEGEAGIGKSTLIAVAAGHAEAAEMTVLRARGALLEASFGYGVLRQLFESRLRRMTAGRRRSLLAGAAAPVSPALGLTAPAEADGRGEEFAVRHGTYRLVSGLADERPLALLVDDAQWADLPSLYALLYLIRRLADVPVLALFGWRTGEAGPSLDVCEGLRSEPEVTVLRPRTLSRAAVAAVVRAARDEASEELVSACTAASGGNPFLLGELIAALPADADASGVHRLGPEGVARQVGPRLEGCSEAARGLARAVAALDRDAELRHAAAVAELQAADTARAADELAEAGLLDSSRPLRYRHPILRTAVDALLAPGERALLHRRAAEALSGEEASRDRAAVHLLATEPAGDPWVVGVLSEGARRAAAAGAPDAAIVLLERALAEPAGSSEFDVLVALARAEFLAGRLDAMISHLRRAIDRAPGSVERFHAVLQLGRGIWYAGRVAEGLAVLDDEAATAAHKNPRLELLLEAEKSLGGIYDDSTARATTERLARVSPTLAPDSPEARALIAGLAYARWAITAGPASEVASVLEPVLAPAAGRSDDFRSYPHGYAAIFFPLMATGQLDRAGDVAERSLSDTQTSGHVPGISAASSWISHHALVTGDLTRAEDAGWQALEFAREERFALGLSMALGMLVAALRERGQLDAGERVLAEHGLLEEPPPRHFTATPLLTARLSLHLSRRRFAQAASDARELIARAKVRGGWSPGVGVPVAYGLRAGGEDALAREVMTAELERVRAWDERGTTGQVLCASAGFAEAQAAIDRLCEGVALLEGSGRVLALAGGLVRLGAALRRAGQRAEAREPLERAMELAHRCGADRLVASAREELLACGARPRKPVRTGVEALTVSELRVARMASEGLSNPEIAQALFVSRKTIETHLRHVYAKLDVGSRTALADALSAKDQGASLTRTAAD